jgi:hypothetical protein
MTSLYPRAFHKTCFISLTVGTVAGGHLHPHPEDASCRGVEPHMSG